MILQSPLPHGPQIIPAILVGLNRIAAKYGSNPIVRAASIYQLKGLGDDDVLGQAMRLHAFVRDEVTYVGDPLEGEFVTSPVQLLAGIANGKQVFGDCDDHAVLLAAMLQSLGIESQVVAVKLGADYDHAVTIAYVKGEWIVLDPCAKDGSMPSYDDILLPYEQIR